MSKHKKQAKHIEAASSAKQPRTIVDPNDYYYQHPKWSFSRCDFDHARWGLCKSPECLEEFFNKLKSYEGQTWHEILTDKSGRKHHNKNHPLSIDKIIKEAQDRLSEINLDEFETLYSLTITGIRRLWGIREGAILCILWIDHDHEIYNYDR